MVRWGKCDFKQLKKLQKDSRLMIAGGNQYALACAADLVDVPAFGNPYYLVDETIPFYEMVIHGSVDYAGEAVNLSDQQDIGAQTLHMLAYGLLPHYCLSYQNGSELQDTAFQNYYSTGYQNWLNGAAESYRKICDENRPVRPVPGRRFRNRVRQRCFRLCKLQLGTGDGWLRNN